MTYTRKCKRKRKDGRIVTYYAEVRSVRVGKMVKQIHIRSLGRVPKSSTSFQIESVHFSYLAIRLMQNALTPRDVFEMLENMGHPVRKGYLEEIGIYYNFEKKTFYISLFCRKK